MEDVAEEASVGEGPVEEGLVQLAAGPVLVVASLQLQRGWASTFYPEIKIRV